jgi:hypothetical protein
MGLLQKNVVRRNERPALAVAARPHYLIVAETEGLSMRVAILCAALLLAASAARAADAPVEVMIVGTFHMSNPDHDLHNMQVDDVLAPAMQAQIQGVTDGLARFHPTMIDVEWPKDLTDQRYADYLSGTLAPSHNEVVQLGFRLAKQSGLSTVNGIDVDGDFPYEKVDAFAKAHGQDALLADANAQVQAMIERQDALLKSKGVADVLKAFNDPADIAHGNEFYRLMLRIGAGDQQPGADLLSAWYSRNFRICANIVQLAKPGDRVVVFFGSGHAFLLRQCIQESPGFKLVEPNGYY